MADEIKAACKHENVGIGSYQVVNANTSVTLVRDEKTNEVVGYEFNRIDGEVGDPDFYCEDCGDILTWEQVQGS